ncbi:thiamine-phosphate kinase [Caldanaerobius fijiensis DSM 17918]|uniref:Thiamine-phosphate kinase n=1 Tax=Caldanaerobius fijiensis DSM 17918 TaxID=1121256 RepID=A0A1M4VLU8_9THEO|nr:AIR synthase family protein [Caldanaerobius fijiensis]SHE69908.1 thiamine-phosphate kinase [Caldanaerobius fijiensis DSM 17918]
MKTGKVLPELLKKYAYNNIGLKRNEVIAHAGVGMDCSIIDFGENVAVLSTDPITAAEKNSGYLSVIISCNDIAACGAKPLGILVTILLPENASESIFKDMMESIDKAAKELGIEVLGGHSEVTPSVTKPVICTTALGIAKKNSFVTASNAKVGDDIIVTKSIGLEGTAIIAYDYEYILTKNFSHEMVERAKNFLKEICVIKDGLIASSTGVNAMHDITEGGLLGAAYEVAEASGVGIEIYLDNVPIRPETKYICNFFNINPLGLISSGSLLISSKNGKNVVSKLKESGIDATIIGKVIPEGLYIISSNGEKNPLIPPERDELFKIKENFPC